MKYFYVLALCGLFVQVNAQVPYMVKDVHESLSFNYGPKGLTDVNGTLFFAGSDQEYSHILWKSDGTESGTVIIKEVYLAGNGGDGNLTNISGTLFFTAFDSLGSTNEELWKSDGTAAGTVRVADIFPGIQSSIGYDFKMVDRNGIGYFTANDGVHGNELWRTDGTVSGTTMVRDINPGPNDAFPTHMIVMNGTLYFFADNGTSGVELWRSDGSTSGTTMVKDIIPGPNGVSLQPAFAQVNGALYFCVYKGIYMNELWKSDGSEAGTVRVTHSNGIFAFPSPIIEMTNFNNTLYFTTGGVVDLWKSNGTDAGTTQLSYLFKGSSFAGAGNLVNASNTLLFTGADNAYGSELWKSNGTLVSTVLVKDIRIGQASSSPGGYLHVDGITYFNAQDGVNGTEVWKTDGTANGTVMLAQINPGAGFATPALFTLSGDKVFFIADDGLHGTELWALDLMTSYDVPESPEMDILTLMPNPVINELTIVLSSAKEGEPFVITNMTGQKVMDGILKGTKTQISVNLLTAGIYFLQVEKAVPKPFHVVR